MNVKPLFLVFALVSAMGMAEAAQIAILANNSGRHRGEFDSAFAELGWDATTYFDTNESMAKLGAEIGRYEMILVQPLFAWKPAADFDPDVTALRRWIEDGGFLVVTDGSYEGPRALLAKMDGRLGGLKTGNCTSSQWTVRGYTTNTEPLHTVRTFPNLLSDGDSWPHFEELASGSPWQVVTRCSEGKPVILFSEMGKGAILLSSLRQQAPKNLENYYAYSQLKKCGLTVSKFALSPLLPGPGSVAVTLTREPPAGTTLIYSLSGTGPRGKPARQEFLAPFAGLSAQTNFCVSLRGEVDVTLEIAQGGATNVISRRKAKLPQLVEVGPNAYRGILSTQRRLTDVQFPVRFAPEWEILTGAKVTLDVYDGLSNKFATAEHLLPTNDVPSEMWFKVPIEKGAMPGVYRIRATLFQPPRRGVKPYRAMAENYFEILAPRPAQTVIDEDQTFLVNGKPFFPLGIYHINPTEYETAAKLGFNTIQFWAWHALGDEFGVQRGMYKAMGNGLRCLFEANHRNERIYRDQAATYADHPGLLMWYLADEPNEGQAKMLREHNGWRHAFDKNHPTFVASCRPDLFAFHASFADVFAMDPYGDERKMIDWCRRAEREVASHKPVVVVPWADSRDADSEDGAKIVPLQAWTAIVHGARGLIWYCWRQAGGGPLGIGLGTNPKNQEVFGKLLPLIREVTPGLTAVNRRSFEEGDVHGLVCGDRARFCYLILVNTNEREARTVELKLPEMSRVTKVYLPQKKVPRIGRDGKEVKNRDGTVALEDGTLELPEKGTVSLTLAPGETVIYRW